MFDKLLETETKSIYALLSGTTTRGGNPANPFNIPDYQRPYSWTTDEFEMLL